MTTNEIRQKFLDFFASKGHTIVASDSLVPKNDPTVLFTTAGMQQFKRQFLGHIEGYARAASSQKCLRTDDLDEVGKTNYHHTFFEMLGNFSFGDYFKKEAITWAWEFLTETLGIPKDKLWVSVYKEDTEAEEIWLKSVGIPKDRLVKLGDKSNFWPSEAKQKGPNGPCGPCSEIFYDYGPNSTCTQKTCDPSCDCGRFSEVWNLVFTQFNRKEDATLEPLPNKNIDTGMGLERLAAVLQGKTNNFDTDLFEPIFAAIDKNVVRGNTEITVTEKRIIADHIRAIVIGIHDGVVPSNEGRGYVMKRLIINSCDIALRAGIKEAVIYKLVGAMISAMSEPYPEMKNKQMNIEDIIRSVEQSYIKVRKERIPMLKKEISAVIESTTSMDEKAQRLGEIYFNYRDTYGLTIPAIEETALSAGASSELNSVAINHYARHMEQQKERSRTSSKMLGDVFVNAEMQLDVPKTVFVGYTAHETTGKILKMFSGTEAINEAKKGDEITLVLNQTPFYAESGGQIGDTGTLTNDTAAIDITDTQNIAGIYVHSGIIKEGTIKCNDTVRAQIDTQRRLAIMRNHTATHLLQAALREILGTHIQQQGSLVTDERLRFDFTHPKAVTKDELEQIEAAINAYIVNCADIAKQTLSLKEAQKQGALAFFAEKYEAKVNVVSIGEYSKELCGGTHLENIGQIGLFKIISESAIAQGIRRIEAKTGSGALAYIKKKEKILEKTAALLKSSPEEVAERVSRQVKRIKELEKEIGALQYQAITGSLDALIDKAVTIQKTKVIHHVFKDVPIDVLRKIADALKKKAKSAVVAIGSSGGENASIVIAVTDDLVKRNVKASELITDIAAAINGSGGGRPQLAQAGSKDTTHLKNAVARIEKLVKEKLSS